MVSLEKGGGLLALPINMRHHSPPTPSPPESPRHWAAILPSDLWLHIASYCGWGIELLTLLGHFQPSLKTFTTLNLGPPPTSLWPGASTTTSGMSKTKSVYGLLVGAVLMLPLSPPAWHLLMMVMMTIISRDRIKIGTGGGNGTRPYLTLSNHPPQPHIHGPVVLPHHG